MPLKYETEDGEQHAAVTIHSIGHEGSLVVDALTGAILTPMMERPDWSEGLAVALLYEHVHFYTSRLGHYGTPEVYAKEDLAWVGVSHDGDELEIEADAEYRMDRLASNLGIDREEGTLEGAIAEAEMSFDRLRTKDDVAALEANQAQGFNEEENRKAGAL